MAYKDECDTMDKLLKNQNDEGPVFKGYTTHKNIIKNLKDEPSLKELYRKTLKIIETDTNRKMKQYHIGALEASYPADKMFDINDIKTWVFEGDVKARWDRIKHHFDGLLVLATTARDTPTKVNLKEVCDEINENQSKDLQEFAVSNTTVVSTNADFAIIYMAYVFKRQDESDMKYVAKMDLLLKKQKEVIKGYTTHKNIINNLEDRPSLKQLFCQTLRSIEAETNRKVKQYHIGASEARYPHRRELFDINDIRTWVVEGGVKARWNRIKHHFDGLLVLATTTRENLREVNLEGLRDEIKNETRTEDVAVSNTTEVSTNADIAVIYMAYVFTQSDEEDMQEYVEEWEDEYKQYERTETLTVSTDKSKEYDSLLKLKQRGTFASKLININRTLQNQLRRHTEEGCDSTSISTYKELASVLIEHAKRVLINIEEKSAKKIRKFVIGQTSAKKKDSGEEFDCTKVESWKQEDGMKSRWADYRDGGFDGLIGLCAITVDTIPQSIKDARNFRWINEIQCAKALEQHLIQYFMLEKEDSRVANKSFQTGGVAKEVKAGVVYIAYMLSDCPLPVLNRDSED